MEKISPKRRVVITGLGILHSLGNDIQSFWDNLLAGQSGIKKISRWDPSEFPTQIGAEVLDFDPKDYMDAKEVRRNDRYTHFALAASKIAIKDSQLDFCKEDKERVGIIIGSGIGGMNTIETQTKRFYEMGPRKVSPFMIPSLIANSASGIVAMEIGALGPNFSVVSACATGTHAIGESMLHLQSGTVDIMIAGGSEAAVTPLGYAGFCNMKAMSTSSNDEPERASRPFDMERDGFVMGEGSGVIVLETLEHAQARRAKIYCELVGYAATCDAYHITTPDLDGRGLTLCIQNALKAANLKTTDVDYINAHGTSTGPNDKVETQAIKNVFGDHAYNVYVSSTKSMTGHLLGAAGGIESAATAKVIQTGEIPPTINYENPDPDCDLNYVPNTKKSGTIKVAMSTNSGFGGHNASIVLKSL